MSREIKFRAWDKEDKVMIEWEELKDNMDLGKLLCNEYEQYDEYEVMQYAGLKDTNGAEIYEGDIIKGRITDHEEEGFYMQIEGIVEFDNGSFNIKNPLMTYYRWTNYEVEVIGNIYENKNLLEEK